MDKLYSGVASKVKKGLEISLLSLIDAVNGTAWALDVKQTPPALSAKEGSEHDYTRGDFYMEQAGLKSNFCSVTLSSFVA